MIVDLALSTTGSQLIASTLPQVWSIADQVLFKPHALG